MTENQKVIVEKITALTDLLVKFILMQTNTEGDEKRSTGEREQSDEGKGSFSKTSAKLKGGVKLVFPSFKGSEDPTNWLCIDEQYFCLQEIPESERVSYVSYHLDDDA